MTGSVVTSVKNSIRNSFETGARNYHTQARLQESVAQRLAASLKPWRRMLPNGPIFEMGAGTGYFTKELLNLFPDVSIDVADISENMLRECRNNLGGQKLINFMNIDVEEWEPPSDHYSLIAGNFVAQWFSDPAGTLERLTKSLKPGGLLLTSFPGEQSFPEWKKYCTLTDTPFTRNRLPNIEELSVKLSMGPVKIDFHEDTDTLQFEKSLDFFRHLKEIGANTSVKQEQMTPGQFRNLIGRWDSDTDNRICVSYHLVFLAVQRC